MIWQGKIIGGSLGSFFGPIGSLVGATAGHLFVDRKRAKEEKLQRQRFLVTAAAAMAEFARTDSPLNQDEAACALNMLKDFNGSLSNPFPVNQLPAVFNSSIKVNNAIAKLIIDFRGRPELMRLPLFWFLRLALSDGPIKQIEREIIFNLPPQLGVPPQIAEVLFRVYLSPDELNPAGSDRLKAAETLGVGSAASSDEIKRAFRTLSMKYHPDRHANLPPEILALATEKFTQVKSAYDTLMAITGADTENFSWGRAPGVKTITLRRAGDSTLCFICGKEIHLAEPFNPFISRCPHCMALLTFERELAEIL